MQETIMFKKCWCDLGCEKVIVISSKDKIRTKKIERCGKLCPYVIFPDKGSPKERTAYKTGMPSLYSETMDLKTGAVYLYEEETQV